MSSFPTEIDFKQPKRGRKYNRLDGVKVIRQGLEAYDPYSDGSENYQTIRTNGTSSHDARRVVYIEQSPMVDDTTIEETAVDENDFAALFQKYPDVVDKDAEVEEESAIDAVRTQLADINMEDFEDNYEKMLRLHQDALDQQEWLDDQKVDERSLRGTNRRFKLANAQDGRITKRRHGHDKSTKRFEGVEYKPVYTYIDGEKKIVDYKEVRNNRAYNRRKFHPNRDELEDPGTVPTTAVSLRIQEKERKQRNWWKNRIDAARARHELERKARARREAHFEYTKKNDPTKGGRKDQINSVLTAQDVRNSVYSGAIIQRSRTWTGR